MCAYIQTSKLANEGGNKCQSTKDVAESCTCLKCAVVRSGATEDRYVKKRVEERAEKSEQKSFETS